MKTIYCDGTPKGTVAVLFEGKVEYYPIAVTTHNEAEYLAVLRAVQTPLNTYEPIEIVSDSMLVIQQLNGLYRCRNDRMKLLNREVLDFISKRGLDVRFRWVPREENLAGKFLEELKE